MVDGWRRPIFYGVFLASVHVIVTLARATCVQQFSCGKTLLTTIDATTIESHNVILIYYLLKIVEIKKITAFARIIRGPAGKPENSEMKTPKKEDAIPMTIAPKAYWNIF
jgi:hypothetical protein